VGVTTAGRCRKFRGLVHRFFFLVFGNGRLGYRPQDDAETYASAVLAKEKPGADPRAETFQGGSFVLAEIGGDPSRPLPKTGKKKR